MSIFRWSLDAGDRYEAASDVLPVQNLQNQSLELWYNLPVYTTRCYGIWRQTRRRVWWSPAVARRYQYQDPTLSFVSSHRFRYYILSENPQDDNTRLHHIVSDEILKLCYEASDLLLLPTSALECFGLPILESLSYGLPVISTDAAAIPELMKPILPNCIVEAGNVEALRQKVKEYLDCQLELPSSENLFNYVKQNYDSKVIIPRIISFLED